MKYALIVCLTTLGTLSFGQGFKFTIDDRAFGLILDDNRKILGTGFAFQEPTVIITCAHVVEQGENIFYSPYGENKDYKLTLKTLYSDEDIAVLISEDPVCLNPLEEGKPDSIMPSDLIVYLGYDQNESSKNKTALKAHRASIAACGKVKNNNKVVDFFEFHGKALPGYSGGPVFDKNGKIVGLIREGWMKTGVKGGENILINRAFSIKPILKN